MTDPVPDVRAADLEQHPGYSAFAEARRLLALRRAMPTRAAQRDMNARALRALDRLLTLRTASLRALLDAFAFQAPLASEPTRATLLDAVQRHWPDLAPYFSLRDDPAAALSQDYRRAALALHPDRGGDTESMKRLNACYNALRARLDQAGAAPTPDPSEADLHWMGDAADHAETPDQALAALWLLDIEICLDELDLPGAAARLGQISRDLLAPLPLGLAAATDHALALARAWRGIGRDLDADAALAEVARFARGDDDLIHRFDQARSQPLAAKPRRPQVRHPRQRANLEALGAPVAPDTRRTLRRRESARATARAQLAEFVQEIGFVRLPADPPAGEAPRAPDDQPLPRTTRYRDADFGWQYHRTFYHTPSVEAVQAHWLRRMQAWLDSLIDHRTYPAAALPELSRIPAITGAKMAARRDQDGPDALPKDLTAFAQFLRDQPPDASAERLRLLADLEAYARRLRAAEAPEELPRRDRAPRESDLRRALAGSGFPFLLDRVFEATPLLRRAPHPNYLAAAMGPMEQIRALLQEGFTRELPRLEAERQEAREAEALLEGTPGPEDLARDERAHPQAVLDVTAPKIEACRRAAARLRAVERLQITFWIDRHTLALERLDRHAEARDLLQWFFDLPERWRGRAEEQDVAALKRRLARTRRKAGPA